MKAGLAGYLWVVLFIFPLVSKGADFLQTARTLWFDPATAPELSAEWDLRQITAPEALDLLKKSTGGKINGDTIRGGQAGTIRITPRMENEKRNGIVVTLVSINGHNLAAAELIWMKLVSAGAKTDWADHAANIRIKIQPDPSWNIARKAEVAHALEANLSYPPHLQQIHDFGGTTAVGVRNQPSAGEFKLQLNVQDGSLRVPLEQALGIYQVSAKSGAIDHDKWVRSTTGVDAEMLPQLRAEFIRKRRGETNQPVVVRYLLGDAENKYAPASAWSSEIGYHRAPIGAMRADQQGERPLILRPGAAVWHSRVHHQNNILGDVNPALVNGDLTDLLTSNKWFEALWFEKYLPGAMSRTEYLQDIVREKNIDPSNVDLVLAELGRRFPNGWVLKAVKESHTGRFVITDKLKIPALIKQYRESDFATFYDLAVIETAGQDEDNLPGKLQEHPAYLGWKLSKMLSDPRLVIAQERVEIVKEFRVEGISGQVLGSFSTVDRYGHKVWKTEQQLPSFTDPKIIAAVEVYTQGLLDRLPVELRGTPFAFDIALLKDGTHRVIESNAGPESGYFVDFRFSVKAMDHFLRNYNRLAKEGKIVTAGMDPKRMSEYINGLLSLWKLDPSVHWPHAVIHRTYDPKHPHTVELNFARSTMPESFYKLSPALIGKSCQAKLAVAE